MKARTDINNKCEQTESSTLLKGDYSNKLNKTKMFKPNKRKGLDQKTDGN